MKSKISNKINKVIPHIEQILLELNLKENVIEEYTKILSKMVIIG